MVDQGKLVEDDLQQRLQLERGADLTGHLEERRELAGPLGHALLEALLRFDLGGDVAAINDHRAHRRLLQQVSPGGLDPAPGAVPVANAVAGHHASQSWTERRLTPTRAARSRWLSPVRPRWRRSRPRKDSLEVSMTRPRTPGRSLAPC